MKRKWIVSLLAVVLLFCMISISMGNVAYAAIENVEVNGLVLTSDADKSNLLGQVQKKSTYTDGVITIYAYGNNTTNFTIANSSDEALNVSFKYDTTINHLSDSYKSYVTIGSNTIYDSVKEQEYIVNLDKGQSLNIAVYGNRGKSAQLTIRELRATPASSTTTVSLKQVAKDDDGNLMGSYTVQVGSGDVTTISDQDGSVEIGATDIVYLNATVAGDNKWYRWKIGDKYDYNQSTSVTGITESSTIEAEFLPASYGIVYLVDGSYFYSWEMAMQAAKSGSVVILMDDYTLPATSDEAAEMGEATDGTYAKLVDGKMHYEVPGGVTFLIPYDSTNDTADLLGQGVADRGKAPSAGTPFRTLTVPQNVTVEVNGNFVVNAKRSSTTGAVPQGCTSGTYGKMILAGTMNVNSGATLVSRGYIVDANHTSHTYGQGTGKLNVKDGSTVKILFQIINFRGGTSTSAVVGEVIPINNYSIANIMVRTECEYGSNIKAAYQVAYQNKLTSAIEDKKGEVTILTDDPDADALFKMQEGSKVTMDYDYANDQTIVIVDEGSVAMSNIVIEIQVLFTVTIDSSKNQLPFADNVKVYIGKPDGSSTSAEGTVTYSTKTLPGAEIHVMKNGTLNIPSSSSLFMYAYGTEDNQDYLDTWSNNKLRTRLNIQDVKGKNTRVEPETDSRICVYEGGTVNLNGEFGQSGQATDAIRIMEENATLNVSANALAAPTTEIYEAPLTDSSTVKVTNWTGTKGLLAGISEDSTDYQLFETEAGTGTYKSVEIDGTYYWYKYAVTYNVTVEGQTGTQTITKYICTDNTTFNATEELNDGSKYVITAYTTDTLSVTAGADDPNGGLSVDNGWENLVLTGITEDTTVDVTVAPYQYRVQCTENNTTSNTEYLNTDTYTKTWDTAPMLINPSFTDWDGNASAVDWDQSEGENSTTFTAKLTKDTKINLKTDADVWKVTYKVTDVDGNTTENSDYVSKGGSWTYNAPQPDNSWLVIEDSKVTVTGTKTGVENSGTAYTVNGIGSELTVEITLTAYDRLLQFALTPVGSTESASVQIAPRYFNGTSATVSHTEISAEDGQKYTFQVADSLTCTGATASATKETITVSNATAKTVTVNATVEPYDAVVTINQKSGQTTSTVLKDYYEANETVTYSFAEKVKIDACSTTIGGVTSAYTGFTNPSVASDGAVTNAQVSYTVGDKDVTLNVATSKFDYILTINDSVNPEQTRYLTGSTYTYTCDPYYYITGATSTSGTPSGINTEVLTVSGINDNATITITLQQFARKVYWYNSDTDEALTTTYLTSIPEGGASDSYSCVNKQVAWANKMTTGVTVDPNQGETITVSGIQAVTDDSTGAQEAVQIGLKLYSYDYKVTFNDGSTSKRVYVKDDVSVFDSAPIYYQAKANKYVSAYSLVDSTGAELAEDLKPTVAEAGDNMNDTADEMNGWRYLTLTGVKSDVTVNLTLKEYQHKVTWTVKTSLDGVEDSKDAIHYVNADTASYTLDNKYTITKVESNVGKASYADNVATVTKLDDDAKVTVTAQDYKYKVTWIVDNVEQTPVTTNDDTVVWNLPDSTDGKTYVVVSAEKTQGTGTVEYTNKTVTVTPTSDITVKITTEEALTDYTALWGDMAFRYYKNGAVYSWDGESFSWKLIEHYAWTHKTGSMVHAYRDLNTNETKHYVVPNGSVMIVNPTNQKITATITIEIDKDSAIWQDTPMVALMTENGETSETGTITVTLDAHSTLLISATLTGTPVDESMTDRVTGSYSAVINPVD